MAKRMRKTRRRKAPTAKLARRVTSLENKVQPELKFVDNVLDTTIALTGRVDTVMAIAQGLTSSTRVGDKVNLRYVSGTINVIQHVDDLKDTWVRLWLVKGKAERNVAPTWANTFQSNSIFDHLCFSQKLFQERPTTKVIWTKLFKLRPNEAANEDNHYIKLGKKLGWVATYDGANTTFEDGGLYLFAASGPDTATNVPSYQVKMRVTYYDA